MRIASLLAIFLASATPSDDVVHSLREDWGRERVTDALRLTNPKFFDVHMSSQGHGIHVCGYVALPTPSWGDVYHAFFVNGITGSISLETHTLGFTDVWNLICARSK